MKKTKQQKGITLVALIITILVLLILAVVTIRAVQGDGIIRYAQNAKLQYEEAQTNEQSKLENYLDILNDNNGNSSGSVAYTTEEGVPIPTGFKYVEGTKDGGLVIEHETEGSQFVWVPVTTDIVAYGLGTSKQREPDVITGEDRTLYDAVEANLQRAGCEDFNNNGKLTADEFKTQLTNEFNLMSASVKTYGGFYVGRYETSIGESGKAQSKKWTEENQITSATEEEDSGNTWYGLYKLQKTYSTSSVQGSMIWGSQYDAMMTWMGDAANTTIEGYNTTINPGRIETDVIKKVYDLYGNMLEWTLEANNTFERVSRGAICAIGFPPRSKISGPPTATSDVYRFTPSTIYSAELKV